MKYYLAIDLGATSGRHVIGYRTNDGFALEEIYRFKTGMDDSNDGLVWDIPRLLQEIKNGIKKAFIKYPHIESLAIDTWGVDYVLMNGEKEIPPFYAYRNARNEKASLEVSKIIPFEELYLTTGIQFANFNTIYQLFNDLKKGRLDNATDYLMLPSYFSYKLTGIKNHEYTDESTGALLNAKDKKYAFELLDKLGLPRKLFKDISMPGTILGELTKEVSQEVGGQTKVILCASHDTASAFEAVDVPSDGIIISSGTWSLIGIKNKDAVCNEKSLSANFTNEGGVNYIRYLKNVMGMWIVNQIAKEENIDFIKLIQNIDEVTYNQTFDVNDNTLVAPKNMKKAVLNLLKDNPPKNDLELFASIYHSMVKAYKKVFDELENTTNRKFNSVYIVGGGAKNQYLNKLIEQETAKKVVALPIEATSLGNIKIQEKVTRL